MIDKLIDVNKSIISSLSNEEAIRKRLLIEDILKSEKPFLNMDIETAYALLRDLLIKEEDIEKVYLYLINEEAKN